MIIRSLTNLFESEANHNYGYAIHRFLYSTVYLRATRTNRWNPVLLPRASWDVNDEGTQNVIRVELKIFTCRESVSGCVIHLCTDLLVHGST